MTLQSIRVPFTSVYQLKEERKTEEENIFFYTNPPVRKGGFRWFSFLDPYVFSKWLLREHDERKLTYTCVWFHFDVFEKMRTCVIGIKDKRSRTYVISIGDKLI